MDWNSCFARRVDLLRGNPIRELLKVAAQPGMISFGGGLPAPGLFPLDDVRAATLAVLSGQGARALQYGETAGVGELRDWVAARFSRPHLTLDRRHVLITSGAQQGLDLLGRALVDEAREVFVESPTYLALLSAWRPAGARFVPVPADEDGLCVDSLPRGADGQPRLLYCVPNFQNPRGTTLSLERRHAMVRLLQQDRCLGVIEDDPYGELRFAGAPLPSLFELAGKAAAPERLEGGTNLPSRNTRKRELRASSVIQTGTFSKVLMPGLRVGWVIGPEEVIEKLTQFKQSADLHTSTFNQYLILELLRAGFPDRHLPRLREGYRQRCEAMIEALEKHAPDGVSWNRPEGGFFLFVTLPPQWCATELLGRALKVGVAFVPGEHFHAQADGTGRNTLRLNFTNATPEQIGVGIGKLCDEMRRSEIGDRRSRGRGMEYRL